ncbi:MAG: alanine racemase [Chloroflexota bacterium]|nr:alanine racemase [Chloroflexota bacterium]
MVTALHSPRTNSTYQSQTCFTEMQILPPTVAEINLDAIKSNLLQIRGLVGSNVMIMQAVKANAYGYGAVPVAQAIEPLVDAMAVAFVHEGIELRASGIQCPILVLGGILPTHILPALTYDLTLAIGERHIASTISEIACKHGLEATVHIEVDTGMGRLGLPWKTAAKDIYEISNLPNVRIEGVYSHLATSDVKDDQYTLFQLSRYLSVLEELEELGIHVPVRHLANSAAILQYPETWFDMVRPGLMTYGIYPAEHLNQVVSLQFPLSIRTRITQIRLFDQGESISYGRSFICPECRRIAVIQVGYADGLSRVLSNRAKVMVRDKFAPVVGNICMDTCMIDVTHIPEAEVGDEVVLVGGKEGSSMVEELARLMGTISYEVLSTLGHRVKRVYQG